MSDNFIHYGSVQGDWIDYNGHMNVAYYSLAFDQALDSFFDRIDLGKAYMARSQCSFFVLESHICYLREVREGDELAFRLHVLDWDEKRLHYFLTMHERDEQGRFHTDPAATSEQIGIHVDMRRRRPTPFPHALHDIFTREAARGRESVDPARIGRIIGIRRQKALNAS